MQIAKSISYSSYSYTPKRHRCTFFSAGEGVIAVTCNLGTDTRSAHTIKLMHKNHLLPGTGFSNRPKGYIVAEGGKN